MKIELGKYYNGSDGNIYYVYGSTGIHRPATNTENSEISSVTDFWCYKFYPSFNIPDDIKNNMVNFNNEYVEGIYENFPFVFDTDGIGTHVNLIDEYVMLIFGR